MNEIFIVRVNYKSPMLKLDGKRFGKLEVIKYSHTANKNRWWECKCDCGTTKLVPGRQLMKGHLQSCGCLRREIHSKRPYEWLYNSMCATAKRSKWHDNLFHGLMSYDDFLTFTDVDRCHYCGENIVWLKHRTYKDAKSGGTVKYHLDRKDNSVGYTKDNCVVCCTLCNCLKGKLLSYEEMKLLGPSVAGIQKIRRNRLAVSIPSDVDLSSLTPGVV